MTGPSGAVGLVGLGAIGRPVAEALLAGGWELHACDVRPEAAASLAALGASACASPAAVADAAETVLVSLPEPADVRGVALGEHGLAEGRALRTYVDLSTTGVAVAAEVAAALAARGIATVDAPVTGGVAGAVARTLTAIVAGEADAVARVRPLLEAFASRVVVVGARPGEAQLAKLLNNLLSATAVAITGEALTLGVRAGLDPAVLLEVFNAGTGRNTATERKFSEQVLTRRFDSGFRLALMAKDLGLCLDEARARRLPMPLAALVQQLWALAAAQAREGADHTELVRLQEAWTGVEVAAPGPGEDAGRVG